MKCCFLTTVIGDHFERVAEMTSPLMKKYCDKYKIDFFELRELGKHIHPAWVRLDCESFLKDYDYVMYCDIDIVVKENSPNIFEYVKNNKDKDWSVMGHNEGRISAVKNRLIKYGEKSGILFDPNDSNIGRVYINSGCVVYNKLFLDYFNPPTFPEIIMGDCRDQVALNFAISVGRIKYTPIQEGFGVLFDKNCYNSKNHFIHFYGKPFGKGREELIYRFIKGENLNNLMKIKRDLKRIGDNNYKY